MTLGQKTKNFFIYINIILISFKKVEIDLSNISS